MAWFLGLSPYTWIMIAFIVLLFLVMVLGDIGGVDFDHDVGVGDLDGGLSPLSLPILTSFGAAFGGFGTIFEILQYGPVLTPILAAACAGLVGAGMYVLMLNVFVKTQAETKVDLAALVGYKGQVLVPIRPGQPGQVVVVTEARGRTLLQAIADQDITTDEHVVVDSVVGNSVKVHKV
jgi:membrane-bound ClpP family serine protease